MRFPAVTCFALCLLAIGCFDPGVKPNPKPIVDKPADPVSPIVKPSDGKDFDSSACSAALAQQAKLLAASVSLKSSEVLQGVLRHLPDCGAPEDYCERVRKAVPAIEARPPRHLTPEEIAILAGVK